MKFTAEITNDDVSIRLEEGDANDLLYAISVIVKGVCDAECLNVADRFIIRKYVKEILPEIALGSITTDDDIQYLLKRIISEAES